MDAEQRKESDERLHRRCINQVKDHDVRDKEKYSAQTCLRVVAICIGMRLVS